MFEFIGKQIEEEKLELYKIVGKGKKAWKILKNDEKLPIYIYFKNSMNQTTNSIGRKL